MTTTHPLANPEAVRNAKQDIINDTLNSIAAILQKKVERLEAEAKRLNDRLRALEGEKGI